MFMQVETEMVLYLKPVRILQFRYALAAGGCQDSLLHLLRERFHHHDQTL